MFLEPDTNVTVEGNCDRNFPKLQADITAVVRFVLALGLSCNLSPPSINCVDVVDHRKFALEPNNILDAYMAARASLIQSSSK